MTSSYEGGLEALIKSNSIRKGKLGMEVTNNPGIVIQDWEDDILVGSGVRELTGEAGDFSDE